LLELSELTRQVARSQVMAHRLLQRRTTSLVPNLVERQTSYPTEREVHLTSRLAISFERGHNVSP
jgi:hypothetical protein